MSFEGMTEDIVLRLPEDNFEGEIVQGDTLEAASDYLDEEFSNKDFATPYILIKFGEVRYQPEQVNDSEVRELAGGVIWSNSQQALPDFLSKSNREDKVLEFIIREAVINDADPSQNKPEVLLVVTKAGEELIDK